MLAWSTGGKIDQCMHPKWILGLMLGHEVGNVIATDARVGCSLSHLCHFYKNLNRLCIVMPRLVPLSKNGSRGTPLVTEPKS